MQQQTPTSTSLKQTSKALRLDHPEAGIRLEEDLATLLYRVSLLKIASEVRCSWLEYHMSLGIW